jgi:hypothetical protein
MPGSCGARLHTQRRPTIGRKATAQPTLTSRPSAAAIASSSSMVASLSTSSSSPRYSSAVQGSTVGTLAVQAVRCAKTAAHMLASWLQGRSAQTSTAATCLMRPHASDKLLCAAATVAAAELRAPAAPAGQQLTFVGLLAGRSMRLQAGPRAGVTWRRCCRRRLLQQRRRALILASWRQRGIPFQQSGRALLLPALQLHSRQVRACIGRCVRVAHHLILRINPQACSRGRPRERAQQGRQSAHSIRSQACAAKAQQPVRAVYWPASHSALGGRATTQRLPHAPPDDSKSFSTPLPCAGLSI